MAKKYGWDIIQSGLNENLFCTISLAENIENAVKIPDYLKDVEVVAKIVFNGTTQDPPRQSSLLSPAISPSNAPTMHHGSDTYDVRSRSHLGN